MPCRAWLADLQTLKLHCRLRGCQPASPPQEYPDKNFGILNLLHMQQTHAALREVKGRSACLLVAPMTKMSWEEDAAPLPLPATSPVQAPPALHAPRSAKSTISLMRYNSEILQVQQHS